MTEWHPATLAAVVRSTTPLLVRFLAGFDGRAGVRQAPGLPNHAVWCLGHCALTMHRLASRLDGGPLPEDAFVSGDGRGGDAERFDTESVSYASTPEDEASRYPGPARARVIFEAAAARLASAVASATPERLGEGMRWGDAEHPIGELVARVVFHNGTHAGQIVDLRRALGMPGVIG